MADVDDVLLGALTEGDPARRRRRLLSMPSSIPAQLAQPATLAAIVAVLCADNELGARTAAMEVLAAVGDHATGVLSELLADDRVGVRRLAVDVLGLIASQATLPLLERATADVSTTVRAAALDGIARCGGPRAARILQLQLEADVPGPVALAALLGLDQIGTTIPSALARRWLDDALTCSAALRMLGRGRDLEAVVPSLFGASRLRVRAAVLGLADGLERGAEAPARLRDDQARHRLAETVATADPTAAAAALIVLGHLGDLGGVAAAVTRNDVSMLLTALHRAVELVERTGTAVGVALLDLAAAQAGTPAADALRELEDAVRRRQGQRHTTRAVPVAPTMADADFQAFAGWFARTAGLALAPDARSRVEARLLPRLEARGATSFGAFLSLLEADDVEAAAAVDAVTIHETYFFREHASLDGLRQEIGPALGKAGHTLHVWSAGCSSGEEPYTLAGILWSLQTSGQIADFSVLGTDISPASIQSATRAVYGPRSFRQRLLPDEEALFDVASDGTRRPRSELQCRVRFQVLNLCDDAAMAALPLFDVIFCRNVLIYLTTVARRSVLQAFRDHLRPGGALVLGHAESLLHVENPFELWPLGRGLAYRRSIQ